MWDLHCSQQFVKKRFSFERNFMDSWNSGIESLIDSVYYNRLISLFNSLLESIGFEDFQVLICKFFKLKNLKIESILIAKNFDF